jgi:hypothetical protein
MLSPGEKGTNSYSTRSRSPPRILILAMALRGLMHLAIKIDIRAVVDILSVAHL